MIVSFFVSFLSVEGVYVCIQSLEGMKELSWECSAQERGVEEMINVGKRSKKAGRKCLLGSFFPSWRDVNVQ